MWAQFHADSFHSVEHGGVFAVVSGGGHPVGRKFDVTDLVDTRSGDVGDGLTDGHATRGRCIQHSDRRAFAHGEGFTQIGVVTQRGHGHVGHRHLPRANHLVTRSEATHGTVADADEEGLVSHGRQTQHALDSVFQHDVATIEGR